MEALQYMKCGVCIFSYTYYAQCIFMSIQVVKVVFTSPALYGQTFIDKVNELCRNLQLVFSGDELIPV